LYKQTGKQADRLTDRTNKQADIHANKQAKTNLQRNKIKTIYIKKFFNFISSTFQNASLKAAYKSEDEVWLYFTSIVFVFCQQQ